MTFNFFLIIPPGFEKIAFEEFQEKWAIHFSDELPKTEIVSGGIEIETDLSKGMALNLFLKISTRILLRIESFKCRDFPKLYKKIIKINWNLYLLGKIPEIKSSSKESRVFDDRKIEKCFQDGIIEFFKRQPPKKKYLEKSFPLILFVRFEKDICTISIDTSGDPLFKRGVKTLTSEAPIRENLAAGLLYFLRKNLKGKSELLIDPMCGSGTFLLESKTFYGINDQRPFSFEHFPLMEKVKMPSLYSQEKGLFNNHLGYDVDEKMVVTAELNLKHLKIPVIKRDVFSNVKEKESPNVVIVNPPYGKRLEERPNFKKLIQTIKTHYFPNLMGIIIPADIKINLGKKISFKNGGIKVNFWVFRP